MLYQSCWNNLVTGLTVPSSLLQFVNSLLQTCSNKFGTSSANTSCQQLVNRLVTTCLQACSNLCIFTCVQGFQLAQNYTINSCCKFFGVNFSRMLEIALQMFTKFHLCSLRVLETLHNDYMGLPMFGYSKHFC